MYSDLLMHLADSMAAAIAIAISDLLIVTPGYDSCIFAISELWIVICGLLIAISDPLVAISDLYIAILGAMIHLFFAISDLIVVV